MHTWHLLKNRNSLLATLNIYTTNAALVCLISLLSNRFGDDFCTADQCFQKRAQNQVCLSFRPTLPYSRHESERYRFVSLPTLTRTHDEADYRKTVSPLLFVRTPGSPSKYGPMQGSPLLPRKGSMWMCSQVRSSSVTGT